MFVVIVSAPVRARLFCIIFIMCFIKKFLAELSQIFFNIGDVIVCATAVNIVREEISVVMFNAAVTAA